MADYRLPFDEDTGWQLSSGNWDDPVAGHVDDPFPDWSQAYAFDIGHENDATGRNICAARSGTVKIFRNDLTENNGDWSKKKVDEYLAAHPPLTPEELGMGSHVLIEHADKTVAAYCHLTPGQTFTAAGERVEQGDIIGLADNTGHSSGPHVHFDVRLFWNSYTDVGRTLPVMFEDKNRKCWRPRVGDVLASNNG